MSYKGEYYTVIKEQGIFRLGMIAYCFDETEEFVRMWFQNPIFSDMHEVKIPKKQMILFKKKHKFIS